MQFCFPKSRRLLSRSEFRGVYDQGVRLSGSTFTVFYRNRGGPDGPRAGFTAPKALGKAVVRNRLRRRMREAVRLELWRLEAPVDLVFHPRPGLLRVPFAGLRRDVARVLERCASS